MGSPAALATWTAGLVTRSGEETERAAEAFAALLPADTVLALEGDLGAGQAVSVDVEHLAVALVDVEQGEGRAGDIAGDA